MTLAPIQNALISVSDKLGLASFAQALAAAGVALYSTGGTRRHLQEAGLTVHDVSAYTGFPEMMDGRIKTLHPKVHGGILYRRDRADDRAALAEHGIVSFDLVVVSLYPFEATIARPETTPEEAIEQIDIGGPSLIRAAAKNHLFATVATDVEHYAPILAELQAQGGTSLTLRAKLAAAAFDKTARYDRAIADHLVRQTGGDEGLFRESAPLQLKRKAVLRYGENPHQQAALYTHGTASGVATARQLHGKELSYNNLLDLDAALATVRSLPNAAAAVIKHNNPCGAASAETLSVAMLRALDGDPVSAFGSVIGVNRPLDAATAEILTAPERFIEAIVAPRFEPEAVTILTTRPKWKANVRLLEVGDAAASSPELQYRPIEGGFLVQQPDTELDPESDWKVVTETQPTEEQLAELRFGWSVVRHVKSNAITVSQGRALCGVGAGQMSRVDSVEIALMKAGQRANGAVIASDAFFPFADSIHVAAAAGVKAIIQPGGSRRDDEVIAACNERGLAMIFTGRRHFKH